jgi:hypothetical protein
VDLWDLSDRVVIAAGNSWGAGGATARRLYAAGSRPVHGPELVGLTA